MRIYSVLDPASFDNGMSFLPKNRLPINQMYFILKEIENLKITPPVVNLGVLSLESCEEVYPVCFETLALKDCANKFDFSLLLFSGYVITI